MKENELMIGDWVYMSENDIPREITDIGRFGLISSYGISCYVNNIHPIPLTPEILEKNGFTKNRGTTSWKFETKREDLIDIYGVREYHLSINIEDTHGSGKGYRWMLNNFVIWHVHELQHALRLCRIEKEIKL